MVSRANAIQASQINMRHLPPATQHHAENTATARTASIASNIGIVPSTLPGRSSSSGPGTEVWSAPGLGRRCVGELSSCNSHTRRRASIGRRLPLGCSTLRSSRPICMSVSVCNFEIQHPLGSVRRVDLRSITILAA